MRAGYRFLEKGLPQEALEHFRDVTYELDPDNKTKLHVKAWYAQALACLNFASWRYSERDTEHGKSVAQVFHNIQNGESNSGTNAYDSDEYILEYLNCAIDKFVKTLDLNPIHFDDMLYEKGSTIRGDIYINGEEFSFEPYNITCSTSRKSHLPKSCNEGISMARELVRMIKEQHRDQETKSLGKIKKIKADAKEIGITIRTHKLMNKALNLCGFHKFKKSVNCVDKVIELNPKLAKAWNLKGVVYDTWGKTLEDKVDRQFRFGEVPEKRLEASVEKNVEAFMCYDMAIKLNPKYLKAWNNKARIFVRLGKAIEESRRVLPKRGSTF